MSLTQSVIGESIDNTLKTQLNIRQNALANKGTDPEWQKLYTGKTAWVKLSSSVDVNKDGGATAKKNVLTSRGITGTSGINPGYNSSTSLGTRPIPGITNVSIQAINRFGTLRNATVEFKVYDVERLSELETLYMRPGFSILLEWGHTAYKTSSGITTNPPSVPDFFKQSTASDIEKKIKKLQKDTQGNYAGLFGYIKNFQWSFNTDGSYNCRVDIISKGELLESLQYAIYTNDNSGDLDETNPDKNTSPLHGILYGIKESTPGNQLQLYSVALENRVAFVLTASISIIETVKSADEPNESAYLHYIRLGALLALINKLSLLKNEKGQPLAPFNQNVLSKYVTFGHHYSGDPGIVMLPKVVGQYGNFGSKFIRGDDGLTQSLGVPVLDPDNVHELWLNVDYVLEELNNAIDTRTNQASIFDFLQNLLAGVEGALGGINEFDIAYNEEDNYHYIVDRRYIGGNRDPEKIKVSGKNTTVSNLSITSKLSPNLGTLIAISAQNSQNVADVGVEAENLFKWNKGLEDRIITERKIPSTTGTQQAGTTPQQAAAKKVDKVLKDLYDTNIFIPSQFQSIRSSYRLITQTLLQKEVTAGKQKAPGIIPFELSITLDGIGGFKIGQTFQIEDDYIFPKKYRGLIAFIVTGLEHSIEGNRWTTTIKAQTITK